MTTARTINQNIRLSDEEHAAFSRAAEAAGLSLSEWARLVQRHAAGLTELGEQLGRVAPKAAKKKRQSGPGPLGAFFVESGKKRGG